MTDTAGTPAPKTARRALLTVLKWLLLLVLLLLAFIAVSVVALKGRPLVAPEWVQSHIEARLAQEIPQARVRVGEMLFVVDEDWVPKVGLRDITVHTPDGAEIVSFNEVRGSFALQPLFEGRIQPQRVSLSGVFVTLLRDRDGRVTLSAGNDLGSKERRRLTPPEMVADLDAILNLPALALLEEASLRALTLRYEDSVSGRAWTVDGGRLRLTRTGDDLALAADLAVLGGGAGVATLEASYESRIGEGSARFGVSFEGVPARDIAAQGPAFAWLEVLRAPISGAVRSGLNTAGRFEPVNATLQIGAGVVQPTPQTLPIPFDGARSYFRYDPADRLLRFDEVSLRSKWVTGQATGTATLGELNANGALSDLVGQFNLRNLRANPRDLYAQPVSLAAADLDFRMQLNPFRVQLGRLQISDAGQTLMVDGTLGAGAQGWEVALDGMMDGIALERLLALWPASLAAKTRDWLAANLLEGTLSNINLAFRRNPEAALRSFLSFDYDKARVRYRQGMPPIENGRGHVTLEDRRLVVALDAGSVNPPEGGAVAVTGSAFIIPDILVKDGTPAVVRLETRSSITAALSLINHKPMQVMDKAKMPVDLADGQAVLKTTLALPLKRGGTAGQVRYHVAGDLSGLRSDILVPGRVLTSEALQLSADNDGVRISGRGNMDGVTFDGTWSQPLGARATSSTLRGDIALNQQALDTFGVTLPQGTVAGSGRARVAIDFERGAAPAFSLGSNLTGLRLSVPQVSWVKPRNAAGRLEVAGTLGPVPTINRLEIEGPGLTAKGSVSLRQGGALERVRFDRLQVANWLDTPVDLIGQGAGKPVQVVLRGGSLDLRRAEFDGAGGRSTSGPAAPPMQVSLDRLQITNTIALTSMRGRFGTARGLDGSFEARLNGGAAVRGQVIPQNGRSAVRLTSADAGGVLRSAGLLKQVIGGDLALTLLPVGSGGAFDGRVEASGLRVKDAPGIAALLNAISVVGLVNELNGDGIYFDDVQGDFRLTPDRITLTKSSAVGASMGLSMDGIYGMKSNTMQMQGVISPVYLLNGIGSVLTRRGEGVIGFNYTLSGPATQPKVSVNPLSALAPGFFREIFRRPAPSVPEVEGITESTLPGAALPPEPEEREVPLYEMR